MIIQVILFDCIGLLGKMLFLSNVVLHNDKIIFVEMKTSRTTGHLRNKDFTFHRAAENVSFVSASRSTFYNESICVNVSNN